GWCEGGSASPAPSAVQSGRQYPPGRLFGETDLAALDAAAEARERFLEEIVEARERGAEGVGGEDQEERLGRQTLAAEREHLGQILEQLPDLALVAAAELRRIEEDAVVALAPADLAAEEGGRVFGDPADRALAEIRERLVLLRPRDRLLGRIDVRHLGPRERRDDRRRPGVGEQVEHADRPPGAAGGSDPLRRPIPMARLLGKEPQMAKRRQARRERQVPGGTAVAQYPALRQRARAAPMTRILLS